MQRNVATLACCLPRPMAIATSRAKGDGRCVQIEDSQAAVVRQMFKWVGCDRLSLGEVTRRLQAQGIKTATGRDCWDRSTVLGMLKNPAYTGLAAFGKTRVGPRRVQLRASRGQPNTPRRATSHYTTEASGRNFDSRTCDCVRRALCDSRRSTLRKSATRPRIAAGCDVFVAGIVGVLRAAAMPTTVTK